MAAAVKVKEYVFKGKPMSINVLRVTKLEPVPYQTDIYQPEDGTVYYHDFIARTLYVKMGIKKIKAILPDDGEMRCTMTRRNTLFFISKDKIYSATLSFSEGIVIYYERDTIEFHFNGLCSRMKNGRCYLYKLCKDLTINDGIPITATSDELNGLDLIGILCGKAIYISKISPKGHQSVTKFGKNGIVVHAHYQDAAMYGSEQYAIAFVSLGNNDVVFTIDIRTMTIKPAFQLKGGGDIRYIVGIRKGEICMKAKIHNDWFFARAELPSEYVVNSTTATKTDHQSEPKIEERVEVQKPNYEDQKEATNYEIVHVISKMENEIRQLKQESAKAAEIEKNNTELIASINERDAQIRELRMKIEQMQKPVYEHQKEENNYEMVHVISKMENEIRQLKQDSAKAAEIEENTTEVFTNYRRGLSTSILKHLPQEDRFVAWLTNVDPSKRPNCEEILMHDILTLDDRSPMTESRSTRF